METRVESKPEKKSKDDKGKGQSEEFEALITQLCDKAVQFDHESFKTQ